MQFINARNSFARKCDNDIAIAQTGAAGGTAGFDARDEHAVLRRQMVEPDNAAMNGHVLPDHADPTAANPPLFDEPSGDKFRRVAGDGKTNSLRRKNDRRVHADDFAARITSGPPEFPGFNAASV